MNEVVRHGGCRCGKVGFEAQGQPMLTLACHCTGCQRMTASAYGLIDIYPRDTFKVTEGETAIGGLALPAMDEWPKLIEEFAGRTTTAWGKGEFNP